MGNASCFQAENREIGASLSTLVSLLRRCVGLDLDCIKQKSLMIGDASGKEGQFSDSDKKTAENFGIDYMDVNDFIKDLL